MPVLTQLRGTQYLLAHRSLSAGHSHELDAPAGGQGAQPVTMGARPMPNSAADVTLYVLLSPSVGNCVTAPNLEATAMDLVHRLEPDCSLLRTNKVCCSLTHPDEVPD